MALLLLSTVIHFDHCFSLTATVCGGRDSAVVIATRYGPDASGFEHRWGRDFPHPVTPSLGPIQPPVQWVPGIPGGKAAGAWR